MRPHPVRLGLAAVLAAACASFAPAAAGSGGESVRLAAQFVIPFDTSFPELGALRFGGISGLAPLEGGRELLALSDDRDRSRIFRLQLRGAGRSFRVVPTGTILLGTASGAPVALDPEGLVLLGNGNLLISSEGIGDREPRVRPALVEYTRDGGFVRQWAVPARYDPNERGPLHQGVRSNAGFESLTITPDHRQVFTANELPLAQDGPDTAFAPGARVRILEYTASDTHWKPGREYAYELTPLDRVAFIPGFAVNGLVELLALGPSELLALERGFVQSLDRKQGLNRIRIFRISLEGATDVAAVHSLQGTGISPVRKTLVADLNRLPGLSPSLRSLDNFEALAWIAPGDDARSLLVVSDDNFNRQQVTAFLVLALE